MDENATTPADVAQPQSAPQADTEVAAPETEQAPETQEQPQTEAVEAPAEDIDIDGYYKERYQAPVASEHSRAEELQRELSQLPADQMGNVDERAAAEWFDRKLSEVERRAVEAAARHAQQAVSLDLAEKAQQQQLLEKYPEVKQDREKLDLIFDLRDAAALRGQTLSLVEAAAKVDKLRSEGERKGQQQATRSTQIQAAAHLETSSVKGNEDVSQSLVQRMESGDDEARRQLLKQHVLNLVKEGKIQAP